MKLLYATSMSYPSMLGSRIQTLETARALHQKLGADFAFGVAAYEGEDPRVPLVCMGGGASPFLALRYLLHIRRDGYTHVLLREERLLFFLALYARLLSLPIRFYLEVHSIYPDVFLKRALRSATGIIAIAHGLREDLVKEFDIDPASITVVPDAVDLAAWQRAGTKEEARKALSLPQEAMIALYAGRIDGWKGIDTLLASAPYLPETFQIVIIGGKPHEVAHLADRHPKVRFLGARPYEELPRNLAAADVVVLPNTARETISARHTSPLKLFAYMASERPIVSSDLPSVREIVDEKSATLVAPDDPKALAEGIRAAVSDPEGALTKVARARALVEGHTWEDRADRLIAFIDRSQSV